MVKMNGSVYSVDHTEDGTGNGMVVSVHGTVVTLVEFDKLESMDFSSMKTPEGFECFGSEMPEGFENFSDFFGGSFSGFGSFAANLETTDIDIGDAHISVENDGIKESGDLDSLTPGSTVTITMNAKGKVTYVLVSARSYFGGRAGN
jgi:hypothetical protein